MTKKNLKLICENENHYEYPELNDKLYLHFKGIILKIVKKRKEKFFLFSYLR